MSFDKIKIPITQSALRWVRVNDKNPFEWTTSTPVKQPSELGDNQVLIQNYAVSLNPVDFKMAAKNFSNTILPAVTGYDVSGRIVAIGKNVTDFKVGDDVFGFLNMNSSDGGGALQEYSVGEVDGLIKKPVDISHTDAATLSIAFLSAMDGLRQVRILTNSSIFVPGGSGGVGHFIIQVARINGAKQIITSASKGEGIKILKEQYNIKDVINHATEDVVDRVYDLTEGLGVDIAYDATYLPSSYARSIETVKEDGEWIVLNRIIPDGIEVERIIQRKIKLIHADISRYWLGPEREQLKSFVQTSLKQGAKWIEEGKLKPYINKIIKLEQAENALYDIIQGKSGFGKIVIKIISD